MNKTTPVQPQALEKSIAELDGFLDRGEALGDVEDEVSFTESIALVLHELNRLKASAHHGSKAEADVLAECRRMVEVEGWTPEHDDLHIDGELARAGAAYALAATLSDRQRASISGIYTIENNSMLRDIWPFAQRWWKPKTRHRDLVRAAALIIKEIERLNRAGATPEED
ncbi:hypothetical protein FHS55_002167 [Angulomicrobium tetraedrale]|uniref:Uncharacterized protein n=1 Tax=Ancylobacter tetraedralis TaxID=217068 RepID=A0A839ZA27_9HYPH|nr:hypothetical protein [Ancylobacter tetraedralis]MBB3771568.1 hypothetical protein [Ancylobacter tetraedralis]